MKTQEVKNNIILGIFVLIGTVLFLIAVFFVGNNETLFQRSFVLYTRFTDAGGLQKGDNIWLTGVKVGTVSDVDIVNDSIVHVAIRIKKKYKSAVKKDVSASLGRDGVLGNRILLLKNGKSKEPVEEEQIIASTTTDDTAELIASLKHSSENIQAITQNVLNITEGIESGKGIIGELLTNESWKHKFNAFITQMEITSQNTAIITGDLSAITKGLRNNKSGMISTLVTDTTFSKIYQQSLANIQITTQNTASVTGDFKFLTDKLKNENNTVALILTDTAFSKNLKKSAERLSEDLLAAQSNFLLKGYFKKKKK